MKTIKKPFLSALFVLLSTSGICLTACSGGQVDFEDYKKDDGTYDIVRPAFTPEYEKFELTPKPSAINLTYYSNIYSRGFSWFTDKTATETILYLVKSDKGQDANFSKVKPIKGTSLEVKYAKDGTFTAEGMTKSKGSGSNDTIVNCITHKVHVENLEKGKAYSYKIGSEQGWAYGAFLVEKEQAESITAIQLSDSQTKDLTKLNVWRNTFTKAVDTAGKGLDTVLYNGDQFDQNNATHNDGKPSRILRHLKALDVIEDYKLDLPYMASSGNHEPSVAYANYITADINYASYEASGCYYSYDYDYAHFIVLNSNDVSNAQINWLKSDLDQAANAKWKIVMLHIAAYSTGDHSNASTNQNIAKKLTPIFSEKHVDLVLQAHDHTYNKTKPYKWDAAGYTESYNDNAVVNLNPATEKVGDITYDKNPQGTYYVTTGAAGHRCGAEEEDGIYAEVVKDGEEYKGLNPSKTFLTDKYKIELGALKYSNQYEPYTFGSYTSTQNYQVGDLATGNVNAQMFGVLNLTSTTLSYNAYTVNNDTVKLFDSLDVLKA